MVYEKKPKPEFTKECEECRGYGILVKNKDFEEPYGYPYRPATIECPDCKGLGWVK